MSTPLSLPEPKAPKAPSIQVLWAYVCLAGRLFWVWQELRMIPITLAVIGWAWAHYGLLAGLKSWPVLTAIGVAVFDLARSALRGEFRKNQADTMAAMVRCDWRIARLTKPTMPRLVGVSVVEPHTIRKAIQRRRDEGVWGLPAAGLRLEMRPHSIDVFTEAWAYALAWWATNRYAFSAWDEIQPAKRSPHVLVLDMGELVIPDQVTAGGWAD